MKPKIVRWPLRPKPGDQCAYDGCADEAIETVKAARTDQELVLKYCESHRDELWIKGEIVRNPRWVSAKHS